MPVTRKGFDPVARIGEIPDGTSLGVVLPNGERVCLIRRGRQITAVGDVCTHQEFSISAGDILPDGSIQCAWHGARFDCATGEVKQIPATEPLPVFELRLEGDFVMVGSLRPRRGPGYEPSIVELKE